MEFTQSWNRMSTESTIVLSRAGQCGRLQSLGMKRSVVDRLLYSLNCQHNLLAMAAQKKKIVIRHKDLMNMTPLAAIVSHTLFKVLGYKTPPPCNICDNSFTQN